MSAVVWLPYADLTDAEQRLGPLPEGLSCDFYTGTGPLPTSIGRVELFVLPYLIAADQLDRVGEMTRLRVVQALTAGVDHLLGRLPAGVRLCNAAGVHDTSTAELAVGLALASGRRLDVFARQQTTGRWAPQPGRALADQRVLIIGYGRIGEAVERRLAGFEVASVTRVARRMRGGDRPVHAVSDLPGLLPAADVVFVVAPLTPETEGLLSAEVLGLLPDGALVVNVARGKLIDSEALLAETSSGRLRAALDVVEPEPLPPEHPLWRTPGVLISPHTGGASSAFAPRADRLIARQLQRYAAGEELENIVV